jgi:hypothetical protein
LLKITELFDELRNSHLSSLSPISLSSNMFVNHLNSALITLSNEGLMDFNDYIDIQLTDDKDYYLGNTVSKITGVYRYIAQDDVFEHVEISDRVGYNGILKRNEQHIWFDRPVFGEIYRVYVESSVPLLNKDTFVDVASAEYKVLQKNNNRFVATGEIEILEVVLDKRNHNTQIRNASKNEFKQVLDVYTELKSNIKYYEKSNLFTLYQFLENLMLDSINNKHFDNFIKLESVTLIGSSEEIKFNKDILNAHFPTTIDNLLSTSNQFNLESVINKTNDVSNIKLTHKNSYNTSFELSFIEDNFMSSGDMYTNWEDITNRSLNYVQNSYNSAVRTGDTELIREYNYLLPFAINFHNIQSERKITYSDMKELEVHMNLGENKNLLDLPLIFKDAIIYFIVDKIHRAQDPNNARNRTDYLQLYERALNNLRKYGYEKMPFKTLDEINQRKGYV